MFPNEAAEFVYVRTYSRWIDEESRRETWPETVDRYIKFVKEQRPNVPAKVLRKIQAQMLNFGVLPSMRLLWAAGPAAARDNTCIYNCSYLDITDLDCFGEVLFILMCGTGVGFGVSKVDQLPDVPVFDPLTMRYFPFEVPDSKEGWADSVKFLLHTLYSGNSVDFDYTKIRPRGSRLNIFGGRASGPEPLVKLHTYIKDTVGQAQGRRLTELEVHDIMCEIAEIVVVGGVRRSSLISLSSLHSEEMRTAKVWPFPIRRAMANNSAIYETKPSATEFMKEWIALIDSGSGERGIFNLNAVRKSAPARRDSAQVRGTNPCITGDTTVLTKEGPVAIETLVGHSIEIWNGFEWSKVEPTITGVDQKILKVSFSDGRILKCTPYHKFHIAKGYLGDKEIKEACQLKLGDKLIKHELPVLYAGKEPTFNAYAQGFKSAEGMDNYDFLYLYDPKAMCMERLKPRHIGNHHRDRVCIKIDAPMPKSYVPFELDLHGRLNWLAGLFDGDGTELKEGGLQIVSVDRNFLADVQTLLTTLGVQSKIARGNAAGMRKMPDGRGGSKEYYCQESYRMCIGAVQMQELKTLGMKCERMAFDKDPQRDASQFVKVTGIEEMEETQTVYCFTEPKRNLALFNGILTGQCGEIALRSKQYCNLSTVIVRPEDDIDTLLDKVETATWMGTIQASFTHFPYLRPEWKQNCEEEALLGVSLSGQMDNANLLDSVALKAAKRKAIKVNEQAAKILGINSAAAITCGKPEGTTSQLTASGSGCHPWYSPHFIRRYRINGSDPLYYMMRDQGFQFSPENGQTQENATTWVVAFPCKAPEGAIMRNTMDAMAQLEWYKHIQTNWCEHNQSITVYVKDDEWLKVGNWVYENWDIVNGVSFLPYDNGKYQQAPYEEINEEQYEAMKASMPTIDYTQLANYEIDDNTEGAKSYACVGDRCELK